MPVPDKRYGSVDVEHRERKTAGPVEPAVTSAGPWCPSHTALPAVRVVADLITLIMYGQAVPRNCGKHGRFTAGTLGCEN